MVIGEYYIKCPSCETQIKLVAEMVSPVMICCQGCGKAIVISNSIIFNIPFEFVSELISEYGMRSCGNVLGTQISPIAMELINPKKIDELHELLEQPLDVKDFIKKIK
jgi:hypothetical protein